MFKSCCARPSKKLGKSKSKSEKMDSLSDLNNEQTKEKLEDNTESKINKDEELPKSDTITNEKVMKSDDIAKTPETECAESEQTPQNKSECDESASDSAEGDTLDQMLVKRIITKKRFSVDYKRNRLDFKRFSVDCRRDSATLEELARLEQELARTNVDVRPVIRRKSSGILKSTTSSSNGVSEQRAVPKPDSYSDDDEVFEEAAAKSGESEGPAEPPATPVGRDELALRRHRFFSDLVSAARAAVEHRVRFDPLGPVVADAGEHNKYLKEI